MVQPLIIHVALQYLRYVNHAITGWFILLLYMTRDWCFRCFISQSGGAAVRQVGGRVYLELLTNSCKLGDINYSYINIVGLIGLGISNLLIGLTIFAVKEI